MPTTHLQPGGSVDPMHAFVIHHESVALEQNVQPSIAKASADCSVRLESLEHRHVRGIHPSLIAPRGGAEADHATRPSQARTARLQPPHHLAPSDRAYHFFATTALSAWMSSVCSATMCFSRRFSSSTCFSR
jgi:hypothetical protein